MIGLSYQLKKIHIHYVSHTILLSLYSCRVMIPSPLLYPYSSNPMQPIPQDLIIRALALSGKTMEDMEDKIYMNNWTPICIWKEFSYPNFFYYLLSQNFLARYSEEVDISYKTNDTDMELWKDFLYAMWGYQSWNSASIVELLTKI